MNLWILGSEEYKNSGVYKYSQELIDAVSSDIEVQALSCPFRARSVRRYLWQFLYLPLFLLITSKKYKNIIVYEEGLSFLSLFIRTSSVLILHDIRDRHKDRSKLSLLTRFKGLFMNVNKICMPTFSKVVCVSDFTYETFIEEFPSFPSSMVVVIPNVISKKGFDINKVDADVKSVAVSNTSELIVYVGSDEERKNTLELYKAISHLSEHFDFNFVRAGRAINNKYYKFGESLLKDNDNVVFLEEVSEDTLWYLYEKADVFIMPSLYEGFGRTPIEAQACGTMVISTLNSGLSFALNDSALVIENDASQADIVKAVKKYFSLRHSEKDELISQGLRNSLRFTPNNVSKLLEGLLSA